MLRYKKVHTRDLTPGEHCRVPRKLNTYYHHFVVVEDQKVIEFQGNPIAVVESPLNDVEVEVAVYPQETADAATVCARARQCLQISDYSLFHNNCEHIAMFCKTGVFQSLQVQSAFNALTELMKGTVRAGAALLTNVAKTSIKSLLAKLFVDAAATLPKVLSAMATPISFVIPVTALVVRIVNISIEICQAENKKELLERKGKGWIKDSVFDVINCGICCIPNSVIIFIALLTAELIREFVGHYFELHINDVLIAPKRYPTVEEIERWKQELDRQMADIQEQCDMALENKNEELVKRFLTASDDIRKQYDKLDALHLRRWIEVSEIPPMVPYRRPHWLVSKIRLSRSTAMRVRVPSPKTPGKYLFGEVELSIAIAAAVRFLPDDKEEPVYYFHYSIDSKKAREIYDKIYRVYGLSLVNG